MNGVGGSEKAKATTRASHSSNSSLIGASLKALIFEPCGVPDQLALLASMLPLMS
jgi:hypothetical protein